MSNNIDDDHALFKLIYIFRRQIDEVNLTYLNDVIDEEITVSQLPYFMSIGYSGVSNHQLLKNIKVTRQGVSKTVKELERLGLVYSTRNFEDARTIMIYLTKEGEILYNKIMLLSESVTSEYVKIVGEKEYRSMIKSLRLIIEHTESR